MSLHNIILLSRYVKLRGPQCWRCQRFAHRCASLPICSTQWFKVHLCISSSFSISFFPLFSSTSSHFHFLLLPRPLHTSHNIFNLHCKSLGCNYIESYTHIQFMLRWGKFLQHVQVKITINQVCLYSKVKIMTLLLSSLLFSSPQSTPSLLFPCLLSPFLIAVCVPPFLVLSS